MAIAKENEHRVLALTPNGRDAGATCEVLGGAGIAVTICADMADLCRQIESGAGTVLLTSDSLVLEGSLRTLSMALGHQPEWSDLPIVLLCAGGANAPVALQALHVLKSVLVLDRPVHLPTLISAIRIALDNRQRQYQIRDYLDERKRTGEALRESEERKAFLLTLSDALRPLSDAAEIQAMATRTARDYFGADRCYYLEIEDDTSIVRQDASRDDLPSVAGVYSLGSLPIFKAAVAAGRPLVVQDSQITDLVDEDLRQFCLQTEIISFLNVPVIKGGKPVGILCITQCTPRNWTDLAVELAIETAERTWAAVERVRAEEALRKSEVKYRTLFDSIDEGFCTIEVLFDERGKAVDYVFLETNRAFGRQTGLNNAIGKTIREMAPEHEEFWFETYGRIAKSGASTRFEHEAAALRCFYDVYAFRVGAPGDNHVAVLFQDITNRKHTEQALRESEERFREVLENSLDAAYRRDLRTGNYDYVSPVVKQVFNIEPDVLRSMSLAELVDRIHPDDIEEIQRTIEQSVQTGAGRVEYRFFGDDGQYRWLADHFTVKKDSTGNAIARGGIVREITELRRAQDALKEDDRRKDEFLAMLGHELRNPLAAITSGLRLLRSPDPERYEWVKESLERQTRQVVDLVDDLLDISRITRGKIQLRSELVDLAQIADSAAESAADLIAEKGHAFAISRTVARLPVLGDPTRLQQIIANLLNNAAKYTNDGGRIDLTLTLEGHEAIVRVKDNGMGIPVDMQESIFDLFGQVDSAMHRPQQGLGIGLSLVKMLVELHGGKVAIFSEGEGKGSEFTVWLPAVEWPKGLENRGGWGEAVDEELFDILVVEDNREAARMLGAIIAGKGHTVRLAENGLTAVELAAERQPDLVVLDIGLPDITGYEVAEKLRHELGYEGTLIIAATGYGQEKDRQRSRQAGIDHHLVKPVQYETLALLAREWRRTARDRRQIARPLSPADSADARTDKRVRILVIDDTCVIARITQQMLQQEGHTVEVAFDGPSGIEAARSFRPELILCDLSLPGASGLEVVSTIKADPKLDGVVVAAVTGYAGDEDKRRTKKAGFDAHLVKPVSLEQLQMLVRQLPN